MFSTQEILCHYLKGASESTFPELGELQLRSTFDGNHVDVLDSAGRLAASVDLRHHMSHSPLEILHHIFRQLDEHSELLSIHRGRKQVCL